MVHSIQEIVDRLNNDENTNQPMNTENRDTTFAPLSPTIDDCYANGRSVWIDFFFVFTNTSISQFRIENIF